MSAQIKNVLETPVSKSSAPESSVQPRVFTITTNRVPIKPRRTRNAEPAANILGPKPAAGVSDILDPKPAAGVSDILGPKPAAGVSKSSAAKARGWENSNGVRTYAPKPKPPAPKAKPEQPAPKDDENLEFKDVEQPTAKPEQLAPKDDENLEFKDVEQPLAPKSKTAWAPKPRPATLSNTLGKASVDTLQPMKLATLGKGRRGDGESNEQRKKTKELTDAFEAALIRQAEIAKILEELNESKQKQIAEELQKAELDKVRREADLRASLMAIVEGKTNGQVALSLLLSAVEKSGYFPTRSMMADESLLSAMQTIIFRIDQGESVSDDYSEAKSQLITNGKITFAGRLMLQYWREWHDTKNMSELEKSGLTLQPIPLIIMFAEEHKDSHKLSQSEINEMVSTSRRDFSSGWVPMGSKMKMIQGMEENRQVLLQQVMMLKTQIVIVGDKMRVMRHGLDAIKEALEKIGTTPLVLQVPWHLYNELREEMALSDGPAEVRWANFMNRVAEEGLQQLHSSVAKWMTDRKNRNNKIRLQNGSVLHRFLKDAREIVESIKNVANGFELLEDFWTCYSKMVKMVMFESDNQSVAAPEWGCCDYDEKFAEFAMRKVMKEVMGYCESNRREEYPTMTWQLYDECFVYSLTADLTLDLQFLHDLPAEAAQNLCEHVRSKRWFGLSFNSERRAVKFETPMGTELTEDVDESFPHPSVFPVELTGLAPVLVDPFLVSYEKLRSEIGEFDVWIPDLPLYSNKAHRLDAIQKIKSLAKYLRDMEMSCEKQSSEMKQELIRLNEDLSKTRVSTPEETKALAEYAAAQLAAEQARERMEAAETERKKKIEADRIARETLRARAVEACIQAFEQYDPRPIDITLQEIAEKFGVGFDDLNEAVRDAEIGPRGGALDRIAKQILSIYLFLMKNKGSLGDYMRGYTTFVNHKTGETVRPPALAVRQDKPGLMLIVLMFYGHCASRCGGESLVDRIAHVFDTYMPKSPVAFAKIPGGFYTKIVRSVNAILSEFPLNSVNPNRYQYAGGMGSATLEAFISVTHPSPNLEPPKARNVLGLPVYEALLGFARELSERMRAEHKCATDLNDKRILRARMLEESLTQTFGSPDINKILGNTKIVRSWLADPSDEPPKIGAGCWLDFAGAKGLATSEHKIQAQLLEDKYEIPIAQAVKAYEGASNDEKQERFDQLKTLKEEKNREVLKNDAILQSRHSYIPVNARINRDRTTVLLAQIVAEVNEKSGYDPVATDAELDCVAMAWGAMEYARRVTKKVFPSAVQDLIISERSKQLKFYKDSGRLPSDLAPNQDLLPRVRSDKDVRSMTPAQRAEYEASFANFVFAPRGLDSVVAKLEMSTNMYTLLSDPRVLRWWEIDQAAHKINSNAPSLFMRNPKSDAELKVWCNEVELPFDETYPFFIARTDSANVFTSIEQYCMKKFGLQANYVHTCLSPTRKGFSRDTKYLGNQAPHIKHTRCFNMRLPSLDLLRNYVSSVKSPKAAAGEKSIVHERLEIYLDYFITIAVSYNPEADREEVRTSALKTWKQLPWFVRLMGLEHLHAFVNGVVPTLTNTDKKYVHIVFPPCQADDQDEKDDRDDRAGRGLVNAYKLLARLMSPKDYETRVDVMVVNSTKFEKFYEARVNPERVFIGITFAGEVWSQMSEIVPLVVFDLGATMWTLLDLNRRSPLMETILQSCLGSISPLIRPENAAGASAKPVIKEGGKDGSWTPEAQRMTIAASHGVPALSKCALLNAMNARVVGRTYVNCRAEFPNGETHEIQFGTSTFTSAIVGREIISINFKLEANQVSESLKIHAMPHM